MDDYQKFSDRDKEQFTRLVNLLLDKTFLLRERVDPREKALIIDRDYRFLERFFSVFQGYLALAGWELNMDGQLGVAALSNRYGTNRYRLNKVETYFLLVLRLIYLEESEKMTLRLNVMVLPIVAQRLVYSFNAMSESFKPFLINSSSM